jgi:hypothetical protein
MAGETGLAGSKLGVIENSATPGSYGVEARRANGMTPGPDTHLATFRAPQTQTPAAPREDAYSDGSTHNATQE